MNSTEAILNMKFCPVGEREMGEVRAGLVSNFSCVVLCLL